MGRRELRSPLGRAIGLGSAKEGVQHWWAQRVSAMALVLLGLWFVAALIAHAGADHAAVVHWLHAPVTAVLMVLLLAVVFYHAALGMQVVIEDYVHSEWLKLFSLLVMRLISFVLAAAGIFAVLRIAFGG
ncbi:MAG TPA: succinate dehydrogenase, hydrophobic membrane anchor protein [Stellaceae bacterium]|nr:succinate dehydrogenase, hydrophobic membrane anchor protein [Stellaceae bacterium]